jgi:hypothetical protein
MLQNHARKTSYVKTVTNRMCKQLKISLLKIGYSFSGNISPFPVVGANTHFEKNFAALWGKFVEKDGLYSLTSGYIIIKLKVES